MFDFRPFSPQIVQNRDRLHSKPLASSSSRGKATSGTSFEVLRDFAPVCSENGRLKMAEKSNWQKPPLKTKYKSCRKDLLGKRD